MYVNPQSSSTSSSKINVAGIEPTARRAPTAIPIKENSSQIFSDSAIKNPPTGTRVDTESKEDLPYSPEFAGAFKAAVRVLDSRESMFYRQNLNWVSPRAEEAMNHLAGVIVKKMHHHSPDFPGKQSSATKPLTPEENLAWKNLLNSLPSAYKNYLKQAVDTDLKRLAEGPYSPEFATAYKEARQQLESAECKFYEDQLGWLSPTAEAAVEKLRAIVNIKHNASRSTDATRTAFSLKPLTPDEEQAWTALLHALPPVYKTYLPQTSNFREVKLHEVIEEITRDTAMRKLMDEQPGEFANFCKSLTHAINTKMVTMNESDKGMAITFRFPQCYGTTAHIALAGIWRAEDGKLKMGFCHQESVPSKEKKQPYTGVVYPGFDTSKDYPGGRAPVMESMRLFGPPSANVFPCPHPEAIEKATQDIAGPQNARQYAPTYTWIQAMGAKPARLPPETCFNVTHKVLAAMYYAPAHDEPLLPTILPKMGSFASIAPDQFNHVRMSDKDNDVIRLEEIPSLPYGQQVNAFLRIGKLWGQALPWDVELQTTAYEGTVTAMPGQRITDWPKGTLAIKFIPGRIPLTLNGKPVQAGVTYTMDQAMAMVGSGDTIAPAKFVFTLPKNATLGNAKL